MRQHAINVFFGIFSVILSIAVFSVSSSLGITLLIASTLIVLTATWGIFEDMAQSEATYNPTFSNGL